MGKMWLAQRGQPVWSAPGMVIAGPRNHDES